MRTSRLGVGIVAATLAVLVIGLQRSDARTTVVTLPPVVSNIQIANLLPGAAASVTFSVDDAGASTSCQWQTADTAAVPGVWVDLVGVTSCGSYTAPQVDAAKWHRILVTASNSAGVGSAVSRAYRLGGDLMVSPGCSIVDGLANDSRVTITVPPPGGGGCNSQADVSPDGSMIVFTRGTDVWLMDAGGTWSRALTVTTDVEADPRWSPDGTRIAFLRYAAAGATTRSIVIHEAETGFERTFGPYAGFTTNFHALDWQTNSTVIFGSHGREGGVMSGLPWRYYTGWPGLGHGRTSSTSVTCPYSSPPQQCIFIHELWGINAYTGVATQLSDSAPPTSAAEWSNLWWYKLNPLMVRVSPDAQATVHTNSQNGYLSLFNASFAQTWTTTLAAGDAWRSDGKLFYGGLATVYLANADLTGATTYLTGGSLFPTDFGFLDPAGHPVMPPGQAYGPPGFDGPGQNPTGAQAEPVNTATGSYYTQVTDLDLPGIGIPFAFERTYNSSDATVGEFGQGWTHAYAASLTVVGSGDVTVRWGTGQLFTFRLNADGSFTGAPGALSTLTAVSGGHELLLRRGQLRYGFNTQGQLTSIKDRNNNTVTLAYTAGVLSQITDTVGRLVTVSHTGGKISSVASGSRQVDFAYTGDLLTSVVDVRGQTWLYEYDTAGRLSKITDPNGHFLVRNTYGSDGRVSDQYDARNFHTTFSWDVNTQTATMTDARGKQWKDVYRNGVLWKRLDPLNNTVEISHDGSFNVTRIIDAKGNITRLSYQGSNLVSRTAPTPLSYAEAWTYTSLNDVATYTDGRGGSTTFAYTSGNLTSITHPDPDGTGPLVAPIDQFGRDPAGTGLLTSYTDPRSKTTTFQYTTGLPTEVLSPLGFKTTYTHDSAGRVATMVEPRGYAAGNVPIDYTTTYTVDAAGNPLTVTTPDPDGAGSLVASTWTWAYDLAGLLDTSTDPLGHLTNYDYDNANHLTTVTAPDPDGAGALTSPVTQYAYNEVGDLSSRTDANTHQTTYVYDDARRLTSATAPLSRVWSYTYDNNGNLATVTDANGNATPAIGDGKTTLGYDVLNRLTTIDYSDTTPDVGFQYDANSNRTQMTDGSGTETHAWDALDRLTSITRGSDVLGYAYDASSNLTQRTYPGAVVSDLAYDNDGRLQTVTNSGLATTYGYDQASNLLTTTVPSGNGHVETRTYDRAGRLTTVLNKKNTTTLSQYVLTLDKDGNPSKIVRSGTPAETRTYKYDGLERLTEVCFQAAACTAGTSPFIRWTYDPVGNRLTEARPSVATTNYTYDNADRLLTAGATSYTFDLNGNQTGAGTRTFTYDLANRLKTTTLSATTTTYTYDGLGKRLKASTGAAANQNTNYLWDPSTPRVPEVALERDGANALLRRYQYGWDTISMAAPTSLYYFHYDNLGSMSNLTSTNGAKQWTYVYEPYGAVKTETKNNASAPPNFLKFTGEYLDPTGLYHLRARQYDPTTGRFEATDALPTTGSAYAYVGNQPTTLVDPSGLAGEPGTCSSIKCWMQEGALLTLPHCSLKAGVLSLGGTAVAVGGTAIGGARIIRGAAELAASEVAGPAAPLVALTGVHDVLIGATLVGGSQATGVALVRLAYNECE